MTIRVGINGFGLIGRNFLRLVLARDMSDIEVVGVNDIAAIETLAHLLQFDSIRGPLESPVSATDHSILVGDHEFEVFGATDPATLPWQGLNVDVVIEATGRFASKNKARPHLKAGAKKVIITAPVEDADLNAVVGINHDLYDPPVHDIISNTSCTINCLAPMAKVLLDEFGITSGLMTTVHAYTNQVLLDGPGSDLRRSRAAAINIVPTATEAARAIGMVIPELAGKMNGLAVRVPVPTGALVDLVVELERKATAQDINRAFKEASEISLKGILEYTEAPIVSSDIASSPASCIFDAELTMVENNQAKVVGWFDNGWGYTNRLVDLTQYIGSRIDQSAPSISA